MDGESKENAMPSMIAGFGGLAHRPADAVVTGADLRDAG
jgi:hypothetical protein